MNLTSWRKRQASTLSQAAALLGIPGVNPARTLQRFETGERMPNATTMEAIEIATGGQVTAQDIFETRLAWEKANAASAVAE